MAERRERVFRGGRAMRVSRWPDGRITHGSEVEGHQSPFADFPVVKYSHLHKEVVRVLPIGDRRSESRLALLKKKRILAPGDGCGLETQHGSKRNNACAQADAAPFP